MNQKTKPEIGTKLTLLCVTGSETPYTVIGYERGALIAQRCKLIFNGRHVYFDTIADSIEADPYGKRIKLHWCPKSGDWRYNKYSVALFGKWTHSPNVD